MNIHGRRFDEIYAVLPFQFRALIVIGIAFLLFITIHLTQGALGGVQGSDPVPLVFRGMSDYSGYDPSLAADGEGRVLLAFSNLQSVSSAAFSTPQNAPGISLGVAQKACTKWKVLYTTPGFKPAEDVITAPDGLTTIAAGIWRYETPSILFDPGDPDPLRAWKLYAYKYMWTHDGNINAAMRWGGIVVKYAADPLQEWSTEEWLFGAGPENPPPPYQGMMQIRLDTLDPALASVTAYARPSVVEVSGALVMSLSAFTGGTTPDRTVMIASDDHGRTWRYLGAPLSAEDAKKLGYARFAGATLLNKRGRVYLAAVFGDDRVAGLGTTVFSFKDIGKALLKRDAKTSVPEIETEVPRLSEAPTGIGGGFAAYTDACAALGMVTGEHSGLRMSFRLFASKEQPDGE